MSEVGCGSCSDAAPWLFASFLRVEDEEPVGLRRDMPNVPKTLFAVLRRLVGGFAAGGGRGVTVGSPEALSSTARSMRPPLPHNAPIQPLKGARSCLGLFGTIVDSPSIESTFCSSLLLREGNISSSRFVVDSSAIGGSICDFSGRLRTNGTSSATASARDSDSD